MPKLSNSLFHPTKISSSVYWEKFSVIDEFTVTTVASKTIKATTAAI
jgi:hypothetical protein